MITEKDILELLSSSKKPIKAREIASLFSRKKPDVTTRQEVNRLLYRLKQKGDVIQNESFCWRIEDHKGAATNHRHPGPSGPKSQVSTYYDVLEVAPFARPQVIEKAYKTLATHYHPDRADESHKKEYEERMKLINIAYEVLSDAHKRKDYDEKLCN